MKTEANTLLLEAFNNVSIQQLKQALEMGADINYRANEDDESPVSEMLYY